MARLQASGSVFRRMFVGCAVGLIMSWGMGCDQSASSSDEPVALAAMKTSAANTNPAAQTNQPSKPLPSPARLTPSRPGQTPPGAPAPAPRPADPPPIEFHPEEIDLGTVAPGVKTSGSTYIQNVGPQILKVVATRPSCVCTTVHFPYSAIAPGESVPLEVTYSSTTGLGHKNAAVRILFEGYDVIELPVKAFVAMAVRAEPAYISALPDQNKNPVLRGEYIIMSADQRPFNILAVNGAPAPFVDFDPAHDQPRSMYRLKWDFTGYDDRTCRNAQGDRLPGWLVVETDHPDCAVLDLEVRHNCVRRSFQRTDTWALQEKRALIGALKPDESAEIEVTAKFIRGRLHDDPVNSVVSESTQFTAELLDVNTGADSSICRLRITPAPGHQGLIYGDVRVFSNRTNALLKIIGVVR